MFSGLNNSKRRIVRSVICLVLLCALVFSFFPLSLSLPAGIQKDRTVPFPCQNRPCGCQSAGQCWKSCCCFTTREQITWAKANQVTPPEFIARSGQAEPVQTVDESCQTDVCCSKSTPAGSPAVKNCCSHKKNTHPHATDEKPTSQPESDVVIGQLTLKCQGKGLFWNSLPWAIVKPLTNAASPVLQTWVSSDSRTASQIALEPPEPPPRLS